MAIELTRRDEFALIIPYIRFRAQDDTDAPMLVDSNIILDGRLAELVATGFLSRSLVDLAAVLQFVLLHLRHIRAAEHSFDSRYVALVRRDVDRPHGPPPLIL